MWFEDLVADWLTIHYYHPDSFKALLLEKVVEHWARYYKRNTKTMTKLKEAILQILTTPWYGKQRTMEGICKILNKGHQYIIYGKIVTQDRDIAIAFNELLKKDKIQYQKYGNSYFYQRKEINT